ncbi:CBS domain-containing protein [Actinoplanes awajinensis]|uniref:Signal transduction protein n=1 Tax=Actinoplanes awajinensis subsp. mycoplanecinus TaxID=135947 RepID=A0A101JB17_9ACTN|nr:CBS domain-containing protein [Actinoplanes awajinensis]KUL23496.1 signal transduction protein [Actinoplanes awajinensis subsp. mycoplanecinus]
MRVRDIMTSPVQVVWHNAPIEDAVALMTTYEVTALPVLDADGLLIGMVSDSDLLWHRVPAEPLADPARHRDTGPHPGHRPGVVVEVMSAYPVTTTPGADLADAAQLMLDHDVRSLPVVQGRTVVGIVSRRDILTAVVRDDDALTADVQRRLDDYAGHRGRWTARVTAGVATVAGGFPNEQQREVVSLLAHTVPGVAGIRLLDGPGPDGSKDTVAAGVPVLT